MLVIPVTSLQWVESKKKKNVEKETKKQKQENKVLSIVNIFTTLKFFRIQMHPNKMLLINPFFCVCVSPNGLVFFVYWHFSFRGLFYAEIIINNNNNNP